MKITVLGCGSSMGTPAAGGFWGRCDPAEPRNTRSRASILVEEEGTRILVDTSYDLRLQLNRHRIQDIDALLLSHAHSDHVNGIDDLRAIAFHRAKMIPVYSNKETLDELAQRFPYILGGAHEVYTPFIVPRAVGNRDAFDVGGIRVESFEQDHLVCKSLGFRFGAFAYSVDVMGLDDRSLEALKGVETWLVDASSYHKESPGTHATLRQVRAWVDIVKPKMTYLTVLSTHMDYRTLCDELPPHIRPAWDGMEIETGTNRR